MRMTEEDLNKVLAAGQVKVHGYKTIEPNKTQPPVEQKKSKYGNIKTELFGIKFDSKKEADRYYALALLVEYGEIVNLKLQETFVLQRAYTTPEGKRIKAITYIADFTYRDGMNNVIEDVKSEATAKNQVFRNKWKMMQEQYPQYKFILS